MIGQSFGRPKTARARALCPSVDARHRQERLFHLRNCRQRSASKKPAREGPVGRFLRGLCCAGDESGSLPAAYDTSSRYGLSWPQEGQNLSVQRAPHAGQNHAAPSAAPGTRPGA